VAGSQKVSKISSPAPTRHSGRSMQPNFGGVGQNAPQFADSPQGRGVVPGGTSSIPGRPNALPGGRTFPGDTGVGPLIRSLATPVAVDGRGRQAGALPSEVIASGGPGSLTAPVPAGDGGFFAKQAAKTVGSGFFAKQAKAMSTKEQDGFFAKQAKGKKAGGFFAKQAAAIGKGGNFGGSYGAGDKTSKGPGGTLGHI
jgi:hypothetical protein